MFNSPRRKQGKFMLTNTLRKSIQNPNLSMECLDDRIVPSLSPSSWAQIGPDPVAVSTSSASSAATTTTSGSVVSETNGVSANGPGTWTKTVTSPVAGQSTIVTTTNYSDGVQVVDNDMINTNSSTGVVIYDHTITTTSSAGTQTTYKIIVDTPEANGVIGVSEEITNAQGKQYMLTGTKTITKTNYGTDTVLNLTNEKGQTEQLKIAHFTAGDAASTEVSGTDFQGHAYNRDTLWTFNGATQSNALDNSINGHGTYTFSASNPVPSQTVFNIDRTFTNGATSNTTRTFTSEGNGATNINTVTNLTGVDGKTFSSTTDLNYVVTGAGTQSITGTFGQSNGHYGSETGTNDATNYGFLQSTSQTDQNGVVKTINEEVLILGDAKFVVNLGTDFVNQPVNNASLITGAAVTTPQ